MNNSNFKQAMKWIHIAEGGYVNDPDDRGGETKYGVSKRSYPAVDIAALTLEDAGDIYHRDYWLKANCDKMPQPVAIAVFGAAVHHGPGMAVKLLQSVINTKADGIVGPVTLSAIRSAPTAALLNDYLGRRAEHYHHIVLANSTQAKFARGWFNRLFRLQAFILEES